MIPLNPIQISIILKDGFAENRNGADSVSLPTQDISGPKLIRELSSRGLFTPKDYKMITFDNFSGVRQYGISAFSVKRTEAGKHLAALASGKYGKTRLETGMISLRTSFEIHIHAIFL